MSKNTTVSLTLQIKGDAAQKLKQIGDEQLRTTTKVNAQWTQINGAQAKFVSVARVGAQEIQNTARASERVTKATQQATAQLQKQKTTANAVTSATKKTEQATKGMADNAKRASSEWRQVAKDAAAAYLSVKAMQALNAGIDANLVFEQKMSSIAKKASLNKQQQEQLRRMAIDNAPSVMQTPVEVLSAADAFATAGMKYEDISKNTIQAAKTATVMETTPREVAQMNFDIIDKMKIPSKDTNAALNTLYYHGNQGRFETQAFAQFAPQMLSATSGVGINGAKGLNFTGALTQVLMNKASVNDPGQVKTFLEAGLGNIANEQYVKGLGKFGIDVAKYMPKGKFYGEGGVQGIMDLAGVMREKGLQDPFKLSKAGFQDQEMKKFWQSMMQYHAELQDQLDKGNLAASRDQISLDFKSMQQTDYAKVKDSQIKLEQAKLSEPMRKTTSVYADTLSWAANNPLTAAIGGGAVVGAAGAGGYLIKKNAKPALVESAATRTATGEAAKRLKFGGRLLGPAAVVGVGGYEAYSAYQNPNLTQKQKNTEYTKAGTGTAGALAGGYAGAQIGAMAGTAVFPGVGTLIGGALGGVVGGGLGWLGGSKGGEAIAEAVQGSSEDQTQAVDKQTQVLAAKLDNVVAAIKSQPQAATPMGFGLSEPKENRFGAPQNGSYLIVK